MEQYKQLFNDCKEYLSTRYDLLRLELLDKLSKIFGLLMFIIVSLFFAMGAIAFFSVAIVNALSMLIPAWAACVILGALLLLILFILYKSREKLFINPFVSILSGMLFGDADDETENSNRVERKEDFDETAE